MKIAVARTGYVGLSNAMILDQHHVIAVDVVEDIMAKGNHKVLETYVIHSNKSKLVKSMYRVYRESQGFN